MAEANDPLGGARSRRVASHRVARLQSTEPPHAPDGRQGAARRRAPRLCPEPGRTGAVDRALLQHRADPAGRHQPVLLGPDARRTVGTARERGYATFLGDSDEADELEDLFSAGSPRRSTVSCSPRPAWPRSDIRRHASDGRSSSSIEILKGSAGCSSTPRPGLPELSTISPNTGTAASPMSALRHRPGPTVSACVRWTPRRRSEGSASSMSTRCARATMPAGPR